MKRKIDLIVAVRNEEESIPDFIKAVSKLKTTDFLINIIFIEDNSTDGTLDLLKKFSSQNNLINYYSIKNKFGQSAALTSGLVKSSAEANITLDVDGGHPVRLIDEILELYKQGNDVVQGIRISFGKRKLYRTLGSVFFNLIFRVITGINIENQNVAYRLMSKTAKEKFLEHKRWWYFFRTNFKDKDNIRTGYFKFNTEERTKGKSKFNFGRLLNASIKSPLSIISVRRYIILNFVAVLLSILLTLYVSPVIGILISLLQVYLFYHFTQISNFDINEKIIVKSSNIDYL